MEKEQLKSRLVEWAEEEILKDDLLGNNVPGVEIVRDLLSNPRCIDGDYPGPLNEFILEWMEVLTQADLRLFFRRRLLANGNFFLDMAGKIIDDMRVGASEQQTTRQQLILDAPGFSGAIFPRLPFETELKQLVPNAFFSQGVDENEVVLLAGGKCQYSIREPVWMEQNGPSFRLILNSTVWAEGTPPRVEVRRFDSPVRMTFVDAVLEWT